MSSVSSIRLSGLASGIDTDEMIKSMMTADQDKIDKAQQKQQTITWQQEIYREIISDVKLLNDKYFSLTSANSIVSSKAWNTLSIASSNSNVITATGSATANNIDYSFQVNKLAESAKATATIGGTDGKNTKLSDLGLNSEVTFSIRYGEGENEVSKSITIRHEAEYQTVNVEKKDEDGNPILDEDGNAVMEEKQVLKEPADTIETLIKKINDATSGEIKASYSAMTGKFTLESTTTGEKSQLQIVDSDEKNSSNALDFLKLVGKDKDGNPTSSSFLGSNSDIIVETKDGEKITLNQSSNNFTIDGITYNVYSTTKEGESIKLTSKEDVSTIVDNMKNFVEEYNKIMDKIYDRVTEKTNSAYPPLTEAQKEEMSEDEIEKWDKKAKQGLLRNDSEMRRFMDKMQTAIFGDNMALLNEMGLKSHENYNKKGQISLDEEKFTKALRNNAEKVYQTFAGSKNSVFENMKATIKNYVGGSSSIFAKKAGLEKTASFTNNYYSEQLKTQADIIKRLQNKFSDKESALYKKFANLESSMNKLNNQMSYFGQS